MLTSHVIGVLEELQEYMCLHNRPYFLISSNTSIGKDITTIDWKNLCQEDKGKI
jgi:hypothetical protein